MSRHIPNTVEELIRELDKMFPEVVGHPGDDDQTIRHKLSQRSVVLFLKQWLERPHTEPVPRERGTGRPVT